MSKAFTRETDNAPDDDDEEGGLPPLPAEPLYVDAPEARLPAGGLRAAPV